MTTAYVFHNDIRQHHPTAGITTRQRCVDLVPRAVITAHGQPMAEFAPRTHTQMTWWLTGWLVLAGTATGLGR